MSDYIDTYDDKAIEIEKNFSYDGYQIVRREMFAHPREPAVTIRKDSITFNTACIEGLEDVVYIHVMVSRDQKRMVIKRAEENSLDSIRWCVEKPDRRRSRTIKGRFSQAIYELMEWNNGCRYKILGHKIEFQGETLYVFELSECEIFKERPKRTKQEREERAKSMTPEELAEADRLERKEAMTPFSPADVENTFGLPVEAHSNTIQLQTLSDYKLMEQQGQREVTKAPLIAAGESMANVSFNPSDLQGEQPIVNLVSIASGSSSVVTPDDRAGAMLWNDSTSEKLLEREGDAYAFR